MRHYIATVELMDCITMTGVPEKVASDYITNKTEHSADLPSQHLHSFPGSFCLLVLMTKQTTLDLHTLHLNIKKIMTGQLVVSGR